MDLMSQAVDQLRLRRVQYVERAFRAPWSQPFVEGAVGLHILRHGHARLKYSGGAQALGAGDLVILPRSIAHELKSEPARSARARTEAGTLLSGALELEADDHPLLGVLPPVIHASPERLRESPRCAGYVQHIVEEAQARRDGADALLGRLTEVLFIEVLRFFTPPPGVECPVGGWFSGLRDPAIRRALTVIHERPASDWTVDTLAKVAGKSRSAFAAHFTQVMRETPAGYLTRWRMFQGRALLRQTELALEEIARKVGYGSAAAFSLAFSREHGTTPGSYRKSKAATST
jgi:AraC-like DNA-binding protein